MFVESRDQAFAAAPDDARGLDAVLVILKTLVGREAGHADVVAGFAVALRVAEVDDIYVVLAGACSGCRVSRARVAPGPTSPVARRDAGTATGSSRRRRSARFRSPGRQT